MEKNSKLMKIILIVLICFIVHFPCCSEVTNPLVQVAYEQLDKPYCYGAEGPNSFDCSGFAYYCVKEAYNITLERVSQNQAVDERFEKIEGIENLEAGDILYFYRSGRDHSSIRHVGIYIGNNNFIHCSSAKGKVVISSLDEESTYFRRFGWARRLNGGNIINEYHDSCR